MADEAQLVEVKGLHILHAAAAQHNVPVRLSDRIVLGQDVLKVPYQTPLDTGSG